MCGVLQGSVLGPTLWNLAYNVILRTPLSTGCFVVCYADDTLLLAQERSLTRAIALADIGLTTLIKTIECLGLFIAFFKTEVMAFGPPLENQEVPLISIKGKMIPLKQSIKDTWDYISILDGLLGIIFLYFFSVLNRAYFLGCGIARPETAGGHPEGLKANRPSRLHDLLHCFTCGDGSAK